MSLLQPRPVIAAVYSGTTGGTGKSTLTANLAAYLAHYFPVMLVDLGVDGTYVSSLLHGVDLAPNEVGAVEAWLAALDGSPRLLQPTVKPSARASRVYVMPPGAIAAKDLSKRSYSVRDATAKLYSMITQQAVVRRVPFAIIDTPAGIDVLSDLALFVSNIVLVVLNASSRIAYQFNGIMARAGNVLSQKVTLVVVNKEISPVDIPSPFSAVFHLPISNEVEWYFQNNMIFISYRPSTERGRRWQAAFRDLAEAVAKTARELMGR